MNNKIYRIAIDVINLILGYLSIYAIMFTILLLTKSTSSSFMLFLLALLGVMLSYGSQQYLKHIWSFLFFHVFVIAVLFLLVPSIIGKVLYICYMIGITLFSLVKKLKEEEMQKKNTHPSLLLIFGLLYFLNSNLHLPELNRLLFILTVISLLLFFINSYLVNFELYFSLHREASNVPFKQIKAVNHTIIIFFLGLSVTSMLFFTRLPLNNIFFFLKKALFTIIRSIFSLLPNASANLSDVQQEPQQVTPTPQPFELPKAADPSPFWQFVQNFFMTLLTIAFVVAVIALVSYSIYKLYQAFYQEKRSLFKDSTEFISPFRKKENAMKEKTATNRNRPLHFWNQTNSNKIRKAFYKSILLVKGTLPAPSSTPVELSQYILSDRSCSDKEKIEITEALTFYYEKARYDKEDCTKEDIEKFKKLLH